MFASFPGRWYVGATRNTGVDSVTFSEKLITLRGGLGWTQEQLAEKLGVTRQTVSNWERAISLS